METRITNRQLLRVLVLSVLFLFSKTYAFEDDGTYTPGYYYGLKYTRLIPHPPKAPTVTGACYIHNGPAAFTQLIPGSGWACWLRGTGSQSHLYVRGGLLIKYPCNNLTDPWCNKVPTIALKQQGGTSCVNKTVGNPISIATGNKFQQIDLISGMLNLKLNYNSLDQVWRHSFNFQLNVTSDRASLIRPDGQGFIFSREGSVWTTDADVFFNLSVYENGSGSAWKVETFSGVTELYDSSGRLISITNLQGQTVNLVYGQNQIQIRDEFENTLQLNVNADGQLTSASLNGIVQAQLNTDTDGRLLSRTDAAGQTTTYHYEDSNFPKHLTGITGADGVRFATWAYDDQGRGVLSEHAGQEQATLVFNDDGSTTVTNSLGKQTTYHFELIQGLKRPVAIEGHATENCVAANKAYTYHANGLVETQTDWSGNITRFEYNDRGLMTRRVEAEGTPKQRETLTTWHADLPLRVEQVLAGEKTTYSYDENNRVSVIDIKAEE